jgi:Domain of unknown function (DUF222)
VFDVECLASLDRLDAALTEVLGADFTAVDADTLTAVFARLEAHSRRRDAVEHVVVAEIDSRGVAVAVAAGARSVAALLRSLVAITPTDAKHRHDAALALAPGRSLTGAPVPAIYAHTGAAQGAGELSGAHARVIVATVDALPHAVSAAHDVEIEALLVA